MPIFGQKNVNSVKTTLYYGPKKSIGCPFFPIFHEKITAAIFCQKKVHSLKNTLLLCPYFVKKTSILSKTQCSHVIFFKFFMKNPCCHAHIWSKKRQFCQNYTILWAKKVNRMPFFSDFSRKNYCSHAHIMSTNAHSLKNTLLSWPYFVKKTSILSQTRCSHVIFFKFFMKNALLSCPYFVKKTSILPKPTLYYGPTKSIGCPFFRIFQEKIPALMTIFCQKTSIFLKTNCSHAYILSKSKFSQKHCALMSFFFKFFMKNACCYAYIWSKKRQFC